MSHLDLDNDDPTQQPRVVLMANQIADALASSPDVGAAIAEHIEAFWEPRMRAQLLAVMEAGGEGLHPAARAAAQRLSAAG